MKSMLTQQTSLIEVCFDLRLSLAIKTEIVVRKYYLFMSLGTDILYIKASNKLVPTE